MYATAVVILSDRAAAGTRPDACIPVVQELLGSDFSIAETRILPDEPAALQAALIELADERRVDLILTSGGTGLSPRDRTPQATAAVLDYEIPGIGEAMRAASAAFIKTAMLSRAIAGVRSGSSCPPCRTPWICSAAGSATAERFARGMPKVDILFRCPKYRCIMMISEVLV
jgi:molybdopterin adenylyltransferase